MRRINKGFPSAGIATSPANGLRMDGAGRVQVYVYPAAGTSVATLAAELSARGAAGVVSAPLLNLVQAWLPARELRELANLADVQRVRVPAYVHAFPGRPRGPSTRATIDTATDRGVPTGLAIDSMAPIAMQTPTLVANGANGAGVKVGVMSGDIWGLAASQAGGYLPAAIWDDPTNPGTSPIPGNPAEGTALLEIVHAVALQASLGFCAPVTSVDVLHCYRDLMQWGATVIANDMQLRSTDMFAAGLTDDGSVAWAAEQLAEAHPEVAFLNVAGNEAQDYFQARYTPGPGATINKVHYDSLMDFGAAAGGPSATRLAVKFNYISVFAPVLEWNDPVHSTADSFVMVLVDQAGRPLATATPFTTDDGRPGSSLSYVPVSASQPAYLEIACQACTNPVTLKLNGFADGAATFGMNTAGSVGYGHAVIPGTLTIAAASVSHVNPLSVAAEFFTGPGPFLYGDYTATGTEAKPDLSGVDNVAVSGAGGFSSGGPAPGGGVMFLGTSAAVPNVAGVLADIMSGVAGLPASNYYRALKATANKSAFPPAGSASAFDAAQAGAGLVQGVGAWNVLSSRTIPYVSAVDPARTVPGSAFDMALSGIGFMQGATVNFNSTVLPATFVSNTALTVHVPETLVAAAGKFKVQVVNPGPANTVSNTVSYLVGNPAPEIASWSPQQVAAGSAAFTLAVYGENFAPDSVITFNGTAQTTSFVSETQLSATIPASAVAQAGDYSLVVTNAGPGGASGSVTFPVRASSHPSATKSSHSGGGGGSALVLLLLCGLLSVRIAEWRATWHVTR